MKQRISSLLRFVLLLLAAACGEDLSTVGEYGGVWVGTGTQSGGIQWTIRATLAPSGSTIEYPSLACSGSWTLVEETESTFHYRERIELGRGRCTDGGHVRLTKGSDALTYDYFFTADFDVSPAAVGRLVREQ